MIQPYLFLHSSVMVCVCFLAQICVQRLGSAVSRLSLPTDKHSLERREPRAGGSVGGTLPFRSARALVQVPHGAEAGVLQEVTRQSLALHCRGVRD